MIPSTVNLLGLFEIDEVGTILYARADRDGGMVKSPEVLGKNLFELTPPTIADELHRRVSHLISSHQHAESFSFVSPEPGSDQRVKVLLGRIRHRSVNSADTSVLVHLRKVS